LLSKYELWTKEKVFVDKRSTFRGWDLVKLLRNGDNITTQVKTFNFNVDLMANRGGDSVVVHYPDGHTEKFEKVSGECLK